MKVWVVWSEFNRGYDSDGGAVLEGVYSTEAIAEAQRKQVLREYRDEYHIPPYVDPDTEEENEDWGVDVHVEMRMVDDDKRVEA